MPACIRNIIVALAFAVVLFGCSRSPDNTDDSSASSPSVPVIDLTVAAASDLRFVMPELITAFHAENPSIRVAATYGASGNFYAQLSNSAPFDLFFSADIQYPQKLIDAGHAAPDSLTSYAIGHIVIWVLNDSPIDVSALGYESFSHPSVRKIAIANPATAPYGRAAAAALQTANLFDVLQPKLVLGENIAQTAQFIESGSADIGIIALSLALAPAMKDKGRYWEIPAADHPTLEQAAVVLNHAAHSEAARTFLAFITTPAARDIFARYGFVIPATP